jgi:Ser/Thr protein kinase RdoA (MazF antagonist)
MSELSEILNEATKNYDIHFDRIHQIDNGFTNRFYKIESNQKKYFLRVSPRYRMLHLSFEFEVLKQVSNQPLSIAIPQVVNTKSGDNCLRIGNQAITIFECNYGKVFSNDKVKISNNFIKDLGKIVANLHNSLQPIKIESIFTHKKLIETYYEQFKFYKICAYKGEANWRQELLKKINFCLEQSIKARDYYEKYKIFKIIHTDIRLQNLLHLNNVVVSILDFDDILLGDPAFDLAVVMIEILGKKSKTSEIGEAIDLEKMGIFLEEYLNLIKIKDPLIIEKICRLAVIQCLQVLSIVGRDSHFNDNIRLKNVRRYLNMANLLSDERNIFYMIETLNENVSFKRL